MQTAIDDEALTHKLESIEGKSNEHILSDAETHQGRALLLNVEKDLCELNEHLAPLLAKREQLVARVANLRTALAPHKRLPAEILSHIFVLVLADGAALFPATSTDAPWVFRRVCSRWRQIALHEPRLWHRIQLSNYKPQTVEIASSVVPSISSLCVALRGATPAYAVRAVRTLVLPNLSRITELSVKLPVGAFDELWSEGPTHFADLVSAELEVFLPDRHQRAEYNYRTKRWAGLEPFGMASSLRKLKLVSPSLLSLSLISLDYPWHQLTLLDITGVENFPYRELYPIIRKCVALQSLSLQVFGPAVTATPPDTFSHPQLRSIVIVKHLPAAFIYGIFPLSQLTEIDLSTVVTELEGRRLHIVLKQCVALIQLSIYVPPKGTAFTNDRDLPLTRLRALKILSLSDDWLFHSLVVPALVRLQVRCDIKLPVTALRDMIASSGCKIEVFDHCSDESTVQEHDPTTLSDFLATMSSVMAFHGDYIIFGKDLLQSIARGTLLPRLRALGCQPETPEAFVQMVEERAKREAQESGESSLRRAVGYVPVDPEHQSSAFVHASEQLATLSKTHATEFMLEGI